MYTNKEKALAMYCMNQMIDIKEQLADLLRSAINICEEEFRGPNWQSRFVDQYLKDICRDDEERQFFTDKITSFGFSGNITQCLDLQACLKYLKYANQNNNGLNTEFSEYFQIGDELNYKRIINRLLKIRNQQAHINVEVEGYTKDSFKEDIRLIHDFILPFEETDPLLSEKVCLLKNNMDISDRRVCSGDCVSFDDIRDSINAGLPDDFIRKLIERNRYYCYGDIIVGENIENIVLAVKHDPRFEEAKKSENVKSADISTENIDRILDEISEHHDPDLILKYARHIIENEPGLLNRSTRRELTDMLKTIPDLYKNGEAVRLSALCAEVSPDMDMGEFTDIMSDLDSACWQGNRKALVNYVDLLVKRLTHYPYEYTDHVETYLYDHLYISDPVQELEELVLSGSCGTEHANAYLKLCSLVPEAANLFICRKALSILKESSLKYGLNITDETDFYECILDHMALGYYSDELLSKMHRLASEKGNPYCALVMILLSLSDIASVPLIESEDALKVAKDMFEKTLKGRTTYLIPKYCDVIIGEKFYADPNEFFPIIKNESELNDVTVVLDCLINEFSARFQGCNSAAYSDCGIKNLIFNGFNAYRDGFLDDIMENEGKGKRKPNEHDGYWKFGPENTRNKKMFIECGIRLAVLTRQIRDTSYSDNIYTPVIPYAMLSEPGDGWKTFLRRDLLLHFIKYRLMYEPLLDAKDKKRNELEANREYVMGIYEYSPDYVKYHLCPACNMPAVFMNHNLLNLFGLNHPYRCAHCGTELDSPGTLWYPG